jgi:hypothetical protein
VTSQGHPYAIFQRALAARDLSAAWAAATEIPVVSLADALTMTLLIREGWPVKYARAAARWAGRYATETDAAIAEVMLVTSHLAALEGSTDKEAVRPVATVLEALRRDRLAEVARTFAD